MSDEIAKFLDGLQALDNVSALQNTLEDKLSSMGFENFTYVAFNELSAGRNHDLHTNYPVHWIQHYTSNRYVHIDSTLVKARLLGQAQEWRALDEDPHLSRLQRVFMEESKDFGLRNGVTVPIHGANGRYAVFCASTGLTDRAFKEVWDEHKYNMDLIAQYYDSTFLRIAKQQVEDSFTQLSSREAECLVWIARGKTASEVSDILSLSYDTVVYYLRQSAKKLGTFNRIQTVAKAILSGAIKP